MFTKAALLFFSCMLLTACDDKASADAEKDESSRSKTKKKKKKKDRDEETAEDDTEPSPTATTANPAPNAAEDPDAVVKTFWKKQIDACNAYNEKVGNTTPPEKYFKGDGDDPSRSITVQKRMGPNVFLLEDAGGNRLLADVGSAKITGPGGATGALPTMYSFCDPKVWLGTLDEGAVDEPEPEPAPAPAPAPATNGLAADGLPVIIPAPGSPVPKPQDFDAQPVEVTVRRSSTLKCKTNMVREWLQVRCFSNDLGSPHAIKMTSLQGVQGYKFEAPGEKITLVIQVVAGKSPRVVFQWNNGRGFTHDVALVLNWPYGAPRPSLYFEAS